MRIEFSGFPRGSYVFSPFFFGFSPPLLVGYFLLPDFLLSSPCELKDLRTSHLFSGLFSIPVFSRLLFLGSVYHLYWARPAKGDLRFSPGSGRLRPLLHNSSFTFFPIPKASSPVLPISSIASRIEDVPLTTHFQYLRPIYLFDFF